METHYLQPKEIVSYTIDSGVKKVKRDAMVIFLSSIMAGIFIGLGAFASNIAAYSVSGTSWTKIITAVVFPVGLMLIIIIGADLFTSSCLITMAALEKKLNWSKVLKNLTIVYIGNFVGAFIIAYLQITSGQFNIGDGGLGGYHISVALHKLESSFLESILLGIMCNIVVCGAVLMMYSAKDIGGKIWAGFFPIFAFVLSGFQHSIANMYYFPAAILASKNKVYIDAANTSMEHLKELTWSNFLLHNLIPVSIGNIIGGSVVIGATLWYIFSYGEKKAIKKEINNMERKKIINLS